MQFQNFIFQLEDVVEDVQDWENHIVLRVPPDVVDKVRVKNLISEILFHERYKFLDTTFKISGTPGFHILKNIKFRISFTTACKNISEFPEDVFSEKFQKKRSFFRWTGCWKTIRPARFRRTSWRSRSRPQTCGTRESASATISWAPRSTICPVSVRWKFKRKKTI